MESTIFCSRTMLINLKKTPELMPKKRRVKDRSLKAVISKIEEEKKTLESVETKTFEQIKKRSTRKTI